MMILGASLFLSAVSCVSSETLKLKNREYYAYGYEPVSGLWEVKPQVPTGFGFGFGGLEHIEYDHVEKIVYGVSEQGFITLIDYENGPDGAPQLPIKIFADDKFTGITLCPEQGLVAACSVSDTVYVFQAARRETAGSTTRQVSSTEVKEPTLLHTISVGSGPDHILASPDCSVLAIANEGVGDYDDDLGLVDPEGSITLIRNFADAAVTPNVNTISLDLWTDQALLDKGVHLPLSKNALEYFDLYSKDADDINFTLARQNYKTATVLEPEWVQFTQDGSILLVSLQENNAIVTIDLAANRVLDIYSVGLKCWDDTPIDVVLDKGCGLMPKVEGLCSVRSPDSLSIVEQNGNTYVITADEGQDVKYGEFEESKKSGKIFNGAKISLKGMTVDPSIFDPNDPFGGKSRYFNDDACDNDIEGIPEWCSDSLRMTLGSSMIDYSNITNPHIHAMVSFGGRGVSIHKLTRNSLSLVWDSADDFEREGCRAFPWAHNSQQDEEYAPLNGALYNLTEDEGLKNEIEDRNRLTKDGCDDGGDGKPGACPLSKTIDERSEKQGPNPEAIAVGEACGTLYMVTVTEKNSIGFLYNINDIENPKLDQVFHLSEASKDKNAGVAYADRTLGEVDTETILFLDLDISPTGKPAVMFAGAWSSTISFWEFDCPGDDIVTAPMDDSGRLALSLASVLLSMTVGLWLC